MATKVLIQIQGQLFDFWEFRSLIREQRYNDTTYRMEYLLVINRGAIGTNYAEVELVYPDEETMEKEFVNIKQQLDYFEGVLFIDAGLPVSVIKAAVAAAQANYEQQALDDENTDSNDVIDG